MEVDYIRVYKTRKDIENINITGKSIVAQDGAGIQYSLPASSDWGYDWNVPEGAEIVAGQDTPEVVVNWGCKDGEINCTITGSCGTYQFTKQISVNTEVYGPTFVKENEESVLFYTDSTTGSGFNWNFPPDVEILDGQGSDSVLVNWGSTFQGTSLVVENSCGSTEIIFEVIKADQYPYPDIFEPHTIPGAIEAVDYDYGGEGISYHDTNEGNEGSGPRQENDVDTEYNDNGNPNVGWIASGEWLEYSISVDSASYYDIHMRMATNNSEGGPFSILFNDEELLSDVGVSNTGSWSSFITVKAGTVYLTPEDSLMKLDFVNGGFNLGKITFIAVDKPSSTIKTRTSSSVKVYPVPAGDYVRLYSEKELSSYSLYDMSGKKVENSNSLYLKQLELDISNYSRGVYLLITITYDGIIQYNKVIKQ
jgi:hypothetical protein